MLPLTRSRNRSRFFGLAIPQSALDLDFLSGTLDPRITFTRASSGTFFGSNGLLQTASNDVPRFDYDPVTLAARGLLIEEQRTNLLTWSENFGDAAWGKTNVSVTTNTAVAPDGTSTADKLIESAVSGVHRLFVNVALANNTTYTAYVYAKAAERRYLGFKSGIAGQPEPVFDLQTGTVASGVGFIESVGNGWYRCGHTVTSGTSTPYLAYWTILTGTTFAGETYTGDGTSGILLWGAQLEAGAFPTSYIPTTTTALTRSMDVASMTGTNFSSWFNASEGTILSEALISGYTVPAANFPLITSLNDGTANNFVEVGYLTSSLSSLVVRTENVEQVGMYPSVGAVQTRKIVGVYRINDFAVSANGGVTQTDVSGTVPTVDRLRFGERIATSGTSINCLNGHIRRIVYWPVRISNTQLRRITA